jgi:hypothetical protein
MVCPQCHQNADMVMEEVKRESDYGPSIWAVVCSACHAPLHFAFDNDPSQAVCTLAESFDNLSVNLDDVSKTLGKMMKLVQPEIVSSPPKKLPSTS